MCIGTCPAEGQGEECHGNGQEDGMSEPCPFGCCPRNCVPIQLGRPYRLLPYLVVLLLVKRDRVVYLGHYEENLPKEGEEKVGEKKLRQKKRK